ncbi:MAG: hypothetical protein ING19_08910 [Azospirillum sp.]|nr:hypothetical protein [Azospirillum sp.]
MSVLVVDHTDRRSLIELGNLIRSKITHPRLRQQFGVAVVKANLMMPRFLDAGFVGALATKLMTRVLPNVRGDVVDKVTDSEDKVLDPAYVRQAQRAIDDFVSHLVDGKDTYDPKSAGGFSRPELEKFQEIAAHFGVRFEIGDRRREMTAAAVAATAPQGVETATSHDEGPWRGMRP